MFRWNLLCSSLSSLPFVQSMGAAENCNQVFTHIERVSLSSPFYSPFSLSLLSYIRCSSPLSIFMTLFQIPYGFNYVHIFLLLGSPELDMSFQCWVEGKDRISQPGSNISPDPAREAVGLLCCKDVLPWSAWDPPGPQGTDRFRDIDRLSCWLESTTHLCVVAPSQVQDSAFPLEIPSWSSSLHTLPSCSCPSEWHHNYLVYQPITLGFFF